MTTCNIFARQYSGRIKFTDKILQESNGIKFRSNKKQTRYEIMDIAAFQISNSLPNSVKIYG